MILSRWRPWTRRMNAARQYGARITLQGIKLLHGSPLCEERCRWPLTALLNSPNVRCRDNIRHEAFSPALCLTAWSFSFTYKRGIPAPSLFRSPVLTARASPVYKQRKDEGLPPVAYEKTSCLLCAHGRSGIRLTHYKGGQGCLCEQGENWLQDV